MLTESACLTCILADVQSAAERVTDNAGVRLEVSRRSLAYLAQNYDHALPPSTHITAVHRILKATTGVTTPFAEQRGAANDVGLLIRQRLAREADGLDDAARFRLLATWALAANSLDSRTAGHGYGFDPAKAYDYIETYLQRGLAVDQIDRLEKAVRSGLRVLYIHDNVGEIALDGLFVRELRRHGARVTSAVRGGPITSDATCEDAIAVGLDKDADQLILAGPDTLGISFQEMSPRLKTELAAAELVISKGQANYYAFSAYREQVPGRVFGLFTIKCEPVARVWNVPPRSMIAAFL